MECFARKALIEHAEHDKPSGHALAGVRLAPPGDDSELSFDPTRAAEIHAAYYAKFDRG